VLELEGIDTRGWRHVGGTDAGGYYEVSEHVLVAVPRSGYRQSEAGALASLDELRRLARARGRRLGVIVLVDRVLAQDAAARRVWSLPRADEPRCAQALVCSSLLARAIGSFFVGLSRAPVPTRMLSSVAEAERWAAQYVREDHGHYPGE
jgi:hypothetical protein